MYVVVVVVCIINGITTKFSKGNFTMICWTITENIKSIMQYDGGCSMIFRHKKTTTIMRLKECSDISTTKIVFTNLPNFMSLCILLVF